MAGPVAFDRVGSKLCCGQINSSQNVVQRDSFVKPQLQAGDTELGLRGRAY